MTVDEYSETVEFQRLHSWLTTHAAKGPVAVVTGRNGDMDTIGSYKVVEVTSVLMKGNTMMVAG